MQKFLLEWHNAEVSTGVAYYSCFYWSGTMEQFLLEWHTTAVSTGVTKHSSS